MADVPSPPPKEIDKEGRFVRWSYQFWDYVAKNRAGFANAQITATTPILLATSGTSSFALSHATSGAVAGTFGGTNVFARFSMDARGHITGGTSMNTLALGPYGTAASLAAAGYVTGTTTTGTLTTAYAGTFVGAGDVLGTSTTGTFTGALSTTGVVAGTYGGTGIFLTLAIDAKGRITSVGTAA